jgi:succinate dehydrogenase / fumarate reductase cytochrome b subunit
LERERKGSMSLLTGNVGRKLLMALTGFFMVMFVIAHLAGNTTIWGGPEWINSYSEHLHQLPLILWPFRFLMLIVLITHILLGVILTLENWTAKKEKYAVTRRLKATISSRTMIWTGLVLLSFIVFHLLHFTFKRIPGVIEVQDGLGRLDVYSMIIAGLMDRLISAIYILAMMALTLHVGHGIQSIFQTFGVSSDHTLPNLTILARSLSVVFLLGFGSIPVLIIANILN